MFSSLALLAFVASVSAITVTSPGPSNTWTNDGTQTVSWTFSVGDPSNFTILLTNTNTTLIPTVDNNQELKALVQTSDKTTTVSPPANGWPPVGSNYRVNLVESSEDVNTIYAQSQPFDIVAAKVSSSSTTATSQTLATTGSTPTTATTGTDSGATTDAADASGSPSDSGSASAATGSSGALPAINLHTGFFGATLVLLGALLA